MTTYSWNGVNGDWSDSADWTPNAVPDDSAAIVDISALGSYAVTIASGESFQAGSVSIGNPGATLALDGTGVLMVAGDFTSVGGKGEPINMGLQLDSSSGDGGGSLTIGGTLTDDGMVHVGNSSLRAPTTLTLGGLVNTGFFAMFGSANNPARLNLSIGGTGFTSNSGFVGLSYVAPLTLDNSFTNGGSLVLEGTSALTVTGNFINNFDLSLDGAGDAGGNLAIGGTLTNNGDFDIGGPSHSHLITTMTLGGLVNNSGGVFYAYGPEATVTANGEVTNSGAIYLYRRAIFDMGTGAAFNQGASGSINESAGSALNFASGDTCTLDGTTNLSGSVSGAGTLAITGGNATIYGHAALSVADWSVSGGTTTIEKGASLSVADWSVSGAGTTVALGGSLSYAGTFSAGSGTALNLANGNLTLTGNDSFVGAKVSGPTVGGGGYRAMYTEGTTSLSGLTIGGRTTLQNSGTLTESGGEMMLGDTLGHIARLLNTGTYDIADDSGIKRGVANAHIQNTGLFEKTGGTETSVVQPQFANFGTVQVDSGTLDFDSEMLGLGTEIISGASILEFNRGVGSGQTVAFLGGGELALSSIYADTNFLGHISGFAATDTLSLSGAWNLVDFHENSAGTGGTLVLENKLHGDSFLHFLGDYTASDFSISHPGGNTIIAHA
jgi:hypothetical protein